MMTTTRSLAPEWNKVTGRLLTRGLVNPKSVRACVRFVSLGLSRCRPWPHNVKGSFRSLSNRLQPVCMVHRISTAKFFGLWVEFLGRGGLFDCSAVRWGCGWAVAVGTDAGRFLALIGERRWRDSNGCAQTVGLDVCAGRLHVTLSLGCGGGGRDESS
jgi:hypothetical protein